MPAKLAEKNILKSIINHQKKPCRGGIKTESKEDRYPFIYSRDSSRVSMALDTMKRFSLVERHYRLMSKLQLPTGEFVQRYNYQGKPAISRPRETDSAALVLCGMCHHYLETRNKQFLKAVLPSLVSGVKYLQRMKKKNGLIYGRHSIHENQGLEEGFEIWTNSWACRALELASKTFGEAGKVSLAKKMEKKREELLGNIFENLWNGKHFIKTIKPDGSVIDGKIISIIAPAWAEIIPDNSPQIRKTVRYLQGLWDKQIGGYLRFKKYKIIKDCHWYDGGSGSWTNHTVMMARLHLHLGQKKRAKDRLKWIKKVLTTFKDLPEHLALLEEYEEWKKKEYEIGVNVTPWLKKGTRNAEKNKTKWSWKRKKSTVVPWVKSLSWPNAELVLNMPYFEELWKKC